MISSSLSFLLRLITLRRAATEYFTISLCRFRFYDAFFLDCFASLYFRAFCRCFAFAAFFFFADTVRERDFFMTLRY